MSRAENKKIKKKKKKIIFLFLRKKSTLTPLLHPKNLGCDNEGECGIFQGETSCTQDLSRFQDEAEGRS